MATKSILITGGAGFVGSHLADALLARGHYVRALDNLTPHVHGKDAKRPSHLDPRVELIVGDVRDGAAVEHALDGIDAVFHFAAAAGVGQSVYEVERYTSVNDLGTAVLMDRLVRRSIDRLVVASSMSVYGEGLYHDASGAKREVSARSLEQLRRSEWDLCPGGQPLVPAPTPETTSVRLESRYALSKFDQERMCLVLGRAHGIPTVALRLFNVYGARQSPANPYTGDLSRFVTRLLAGKQPCVLEDGEQRRDFVNVHDVARACCLALESQVAPGAVLNIGSGESRTVAHVARKMAQLLGRPHLVPEVTGEYRMGDVRHCFADVRRAENVLGYRAAVDLDSGLVELARWVDGRAARTSERNIEAGARLEDSTRELETDTAAVVIASGAHPSQPPPHEGPHVQ